MAKIVQRDFDLTVDTWADLQALPSSRKIDGIQVTVIDAIGDSRTIGGSVIYQFVEAFRGTSEEWMAIANTDEETFSTVEERLIVTNGQVALANVPNGNILIDVMAEWVENGVNLVEDVAYSLNGQTVTVSSAFDTKTLIVKYLRNNSGKLYQIGTGTGGVSSWTDLTDKPTTLAGYGVENEVDGKISAAVGSIQSGVTSFADLTDTPTTIAGYGITDAYTKSEVESKIVELAPATDISGKADKATTIAGYGITDAFTKVEVTSAINTAISDLVDSAPGALDTLNELAAALGDDANFASTVIADLATKADIADVYNKTEVDNIASTLFDSYVDNVSLLLNGEDGIVDATGKHVDIEAVNVDVTNVFSKFGSNSLLLHGSQKVIVLRDSGLEYANASHTELLADSAVIEGWFYLNTVGGQIIRNYNVTADLTNSSHWSLDVNNNGTVTWHNAHPSYTGGTSAMTLTANTWHHIAILHDQVNEPNKSYVYINGSLALSPQRTGEATDYGIVIGDGINGNIDDFRVTNKNRYVEGVEVPTKEFSLLRLSDANFTVAEKAKLAGIEASANNYSLPIATDSNLGGIKVGAGLSIDNNGVLSASQGGTADSVEWTGVLNHPTTVSGYGITDVYTKSEVASSISAAIPTFSTLSGKPTTISGYGITDAYTKSEVNAKIVELAPATDLSGYYTKTQVDGLVDDIIVGDNIMPKVPGVSNIGSPTAKFNAVYTKEMHIDANTLYVDGVAVLGSSANTIMVTADVNQGIRVATTGTGQTVLDSMAATTVKTNGTNADVSIQSEGTGSRSRITSNTEIILTAPSIKFEGSISGLTTDLSVQNATISGDLNVLGTTTTISTANMSIEDNVVVINKGEAGSGVSLGYAGFQIDRGDLSDARLVWNEATDKFEMGILGAEKYIATEDFVTNSIGAIPSADFSSYYDASEVDGLLATKVDKVSGKGLSTEDYTSAEKTKLAGIEAGAQVNTVTSVAGKTGVVTLVKGDVGLGSVDNTADSAKVVASAAKLTTARTINGVSFDGTANITVADSTKQPLDADLTAIAGLTGTSGILKKTAADTWTLDTSAYTTNVGTVTSIATSGAITGGTITSTGTITHSTADGYLHVPATSTTNNGKFLQAGATAGSLSWVSPAEVISLADLNNVAIATPTTGQALTYNGTSWVNSSLSAGSGQMLGTASVKAISYNSNTISENLTLAAGTNGSVVGPITVSDGYSVTVADGSRLVIL